MREPLASSSRRDGEPSSDDDPHERKADGANEKHRCPLIDAVAREMDISVHEARSHEKPAEDEEDRVRGPRHERKQDQHIKEERRLKLIMIGVADLGNARRSVRLFKHDRMGVGTWPRRIARIRRNCIQNNNTKVSATCANTGISMACIDMTALPLRPGGRP